jgi:hypothetical protein
MNFVLPGSGLAIKGLSTAAQAGLMTGLGGLALTGSLKKGLMAGMQAFGGASLAGGVQGAIKGAAVPGATAQPAGSALATSGTGTGITAAENAFLTQAGGNFVPAVGSAGTGLGAAVPSITGAEQAFLTKMGGTAVPQAAVKKGLAGFAQGFANTAKGNMTGILGKAAVPLGISGAMQSLSAATAPSGGIATPTGQIDNSYQGPYFTQDRQQITDPEGPLSSKQRRHFAVSMPEVYNTAGQLVQPGSMTAQGTPVLQPVARPKAKKGENMYDFQYVPYMGGVAPTAGGYAKGGEVELADGAFVVDARTVSELGNGSSGAGQELLARMGGRPVRGPGDGVSDSIPARIGRNQPARVARDEVIFPPEAVRRVGKGSEQKGAQKLYALMDKAHKARKKSERGKDTKLRRGLAL